MFRFSGCLIGSALLVFVLTQGQISAAASESERASGLPVGVSADWWSRVQRSIQLEEYGVVADRAIGDAFRATNPAQHFEARFDERGLRLSPTGEAKWEWGLSLNGAGRPGALEFADVERLSADEDRVELDRGLLTERFVNRPDGLEHAFTIPIPPRSDGDRLAIDLVLGGELRPVFTENGWAVDFFAAGNVSVLRYAEPIATDAAGSVLPARIDPVPGGLRIVVEDSAAIYPITVNAVATRQAWTAVGEAAGDQFGLCVSTAGDVNGDGYSDVVVGAHQNTGATGKAYVYLGSASGLSASAAWTAVGEAASDYFGYSVSTAGDVNGDGYSDIVVGASRSAGVTGKAYLYLGGAAGLSASASWTALGEAGGDQFGVSVSTAGDVNGDGYSDVVVGAFGNTGNTGKAYLYLGGASGLAVSASWSAAGEAATDLFGSSVSTAGDVNGDGYADVVVGAYGSSGNAGKAYLYAGGAEGLSASASWSAVGPAAGDYFGFSVSTAGDVNGDGYSEVIIGAHNTNSGTGAVYLYLGGASGLPAGASWIAAGQAAGDWFGVSVSTEGDVNGDGYADVVVGAHGYGVEGAVYVYLGGASGLPAGASGVAVGEGAGNWYGRSVSTAGDVNGDGYSDLVVGAHGNAGFTGKAYLYLGGASVLTASPLWSATGETAGDVFGRWVSTAGDVNGDGYSDVVVGVPFAVDEGKAYLYLGGASGLSASASWSATGESVGDWFGYCVSMAGDVNGDGYEDVVVASYGGGGTGKAHLYLGGASGLSASASWSATGAAPHHYFAHSLSTAGDVNGDGYSDLVVGAYNDGGTGKSYLYLGGASGLSSSPSWTAMGEAAGDRFGISVSTAGDVNGDGYSDVVVGAYAHAGFAGKAYLYLGGASGLSASASWSAVGAAANYALGESVSTAGDVNGDGYSDVVVGAPYWASQTGVAYLYLGSASGLLASASWGAVGVAAGDYFGYSVSTAGDANGDGYSDVVVGAFGVGGTGKIYLYAGSASGLSASPSWTAVGEAAGDEFGRPVSTAGDVNGDGFSDAVVAAAGSSSSTGKAYVYLGGGGAGLSLLPQQWRREQEVPVARLGRSDDHLGFRIRLRGRSPFGGGRAKLEWEVKPLGTLFDGQNTATSASWTELAGGTAQFEESVTALAEDTPYHWRARLRYDGASTPYQQFSRWITVPHNGWNEADLRTSVDADGDGHAWGVDCDDADPNNWSSCATCVDADSDGWYVGCDAYVTIAGPDCDDGNAGAHQSGAGEVNDGLDNQCPGETGHGLIDEIEGDCGFHNPSDGDEFSWTAQSGATSYEVARSTSPQFFSGCTTTTTASTHWSDTAPVPGGICHYYLVRALTPHAGSWGAASLGERTGICP